MRVKIAEKRSDCPVNFAVETIGDKWSLVIIRDIIFWGKRTYGELLKSDEKISTNILADRLAYLEREGIIKKVPLMEDKRKDLYLPTERGLDLVPVMIEMIAWSAKNECWHALEPRGNEEQKAFVGRVATATDRISISEEVKEIVRKGGSVFGKKNDKAPN
jgi:DNA-binding HxlR family transcriptional regulator